MQYEFIKNAGNGLVPSLLPTALILEVTPTVAANTTYTLLLTQYVMPAGRIITRVLSYTTPAAGATATSICDFLRLQLASYTDIQITGSGTATLILTASSASPLFTVVNTSTATMTVVSYMPFATTAIRGGATTLVINGTVTTILPNVITSLAGTTTVTLTSTNHGLITGQSVTISGSWTGTMNGVSGGATASITARFRQTTANAGTLDGILGAGGLAINTATVTVAPQVSRGQYTDLLAANVTGGTAGLTYSQVPFTFGDESGLDSNLNQPSQPINRHTLYVNEADPDFAAFNTRMNEVLNAYVSGGTTSDPALIAVQH
jgi:hypothetical protein